MSTNVNEDKKIKLVDGREIAVRPLRISLLKPFMKKFDEIQSVAADNEKSMDVLIDCVQIAMKQYAPDIAEDKAELENLLDLPTVYQIIEEASGLKLSDVPGIA
jgi:hypothetical protein